MMAAQAPAALVSPGADWGGPVEEEEEGDGEGGGGGLQLAAAAAKRQRNPNLDALLQQKAAKRAAQEARKAAALAKASQPVSAVPPTPKQRGRPSGWTLRPDAPEFLSPEEFKSLSTRELQKLWSDYYTGSSEELGSKSGNRAYLRKRLCAAPEESSTMTSAGGQAAATAV